MATGLVLSLCAGCGTFGGDDDPAAEVSTGGVLRLAMPYPPVAGYSLESEDAEILSRVGCSETLLRYNEPSGKLVPMLAHEWSQASPTEWDFTLRDDVTFQDGTPMDAEAVATSLTRVLEAEVPPRAFNPETVSGIEAIDDGQVRISTPQPSVLLPYRLASMNTAIMAPEAYGSTGVDVVEHCTGPFAIVTDDGQQGLTLERNDAYWGASPQLDGIEVKFIPDGNTRTTQIQTGEVDLAMDIPASRIADLDSDEAIEVVATPTPRTSSIYLNNSKPPFDDPLVRQAVQHAVDAAAIAATVYEGAAEAAFGPFDETEPWAPQGVEPVSRDVDEARRLLEEAGLGGEPVAVTLRGYNERPEFADLAAVIQNQLEEAGFAVEVKMTDYAGMEPAVLDGTYDMALLSRNHLIDIADPLGFLQADYSCKGSFNLSHFCDADVDEALAATAEQEDATARYASYADVAFMLQEEAVSVFLVNEQAISAQRSNVENFVNDPLVRYAITPELALSE